MNVSVFVNDVGELLDVEITHHTLMHCKGAYDIIIVHSVFIINSMLIINIVHSISAIMVVIILTRTTFIGHIGFDTLHKVFV